MKKFFLLYILFFSLLFSAQTDYSDSWEDFYSYNNVKDFVKVDATIYALADNAVFTYNISTKENIILFSRINNPRFSHSTALNTTIEEGFSKLPK